MPSMPPPLTLPLYQSIKPNPHIQGLPSHGQPHASKIVASPRSYNAAVVDAGTTGNDAVFFVHSLRSD